MPIPIEDIIDDLERNKAINPAKIPEYINAILENNSTKAIDILISQNNNNIEPGILGSIFIRTVIDRNDLLLDHMIKNANTISPTVLGLALKSALGTQDEQDTLLLLKEANERNWKMDLNWTDEGLTPLYLAMGTKNTDILKQILKQGVDVNEATSKGFTIAQFAAFSGDAKALKILLDNGASLNRSILDSAMKGKHPEIIDFILERGSSNLIEQQAKYLLDKFMINYTKDTQSVSAPKADTQSVSAPKAQILPQSESTRARQKQEAVHEQYLERHIKLVIKKNAREIANAALNEDVNTVHQLIKNVNDELKGDYTLPLLEKALEKIDKEDDEEASEMLIDILEDHAKKTKKGPTKL